jgi:hypothetical protein
MRNLKFEQKSKVQCWQYGNFFFSQPLKEDMKLSRGRLRSLIEPPRFVRRRVELPCFGEEVPGATMKFLRRAQDLANERPQYARLARSRIEFSEASCEVLWLHISERLPLEPLGDTLREKFVTPDNVVVGTPQSLHAVQLGISELA